MQVVGSCGALCFLCRRAVAPALLGLSGAPFPRQHLEAGGFMIPWPQSVLGSPDFSPLQTSQVLLTRYRALFGPHDEVGTGVVIVPAPSSQ